MRIGWLLLLLLAEGCNRTVWQSRLHRMAERQTLDATAPF